MTPIQKADFAPHIFFAARGRGKTRPYIVVIEKGKTRLLSVSCDVAELLIANGYGSEG